MRLIRKAKISFLYASAVGILLLYFGSRPWFIPNSIEAESIPFFQVAPSASISCPKEKVTKRWILKGLSFSDINPREFHFVGGCGRYFFFDGRGCIFAFRKTGRKDWQLCFGSAGHFVPQNLAWINDQLYASGYDGVLTQIQGDGKILNSSRLGTTLPAALLEKEKTLIQPVSLHAESAVSLLFLDPKSLAKLSVSASSGLIADSFSDSGYPGLSIIWGASGYEFWREGLGWYGRFPLGSGKLAMAIDPIRHLQIIGSKGALSGFDLRSGRPKYVMPQFALVDDRRATGGHLISKKNKFFFMKDGNTERLLPVGPAKNLITASSEGKVLRKNNELYFEKWAQR